jgi:hypothetical protein
VQTVTVVTMKIQEDMQKVELHLITIKSLKDPATDPACAGDEKFRNPDCITTTVSWKAPSLNTALYKYPITKSRSNKSIFIFMSFRRPKNYTRL